MNDTQQINQAFVAKISPSLIKDAERAGNWAKLFGRACQISVTQDITTSRAFRRVESWIDRDSTSTWKKLEKGLNRQSVSHPPCPDVYAFYHEFPEFFNNEEDVSNLSNLVQCYRETGTLIPGDSLFELISKEGAQCDSPWDSCQWYQKARELQGIASGRAHLRYDSIIRVSLIASVLFLSAAYFSLFAQFGFALSLLFLIYAINERYFAFI